MTDIDHMIAVMRAAKEGKAIQSRHRPHRDIDVCWKDAPKPSWDWATFDYRIKPAEPRRVWVNMYGSHSTVGYAFYSRQIADTHAGVERVECVEFVEVVK